MGVRSTDLANKLIPVNIQTFRNATRDICFDVYLKLSEDNIAHVFSRTTGLDYKRLAQYISKGVQELYIQESDLPAYKDFVARPAHVIFADPATSQETKIATLINMTEQNMAEVFTQLNVNNETAEGSRRVINGYVKLMTTQPQSLAMLLKLVSHGEYMYYHSIAVAIFSMFIAKASGQFNQRMMEFVGMGGFLHDIGMTQLDKDIVETSKTYEEEDVAAMQEHPQIGLKMLETATNIPEEVRYIVYQHHERPGGGGYPNKLHSAVIYYPAKIVAIADAFSALISKRPHRPAFTVEKAIEILRADTKKGKYDPALVEILAGVFLRQTKAA